MVFLDSRGEVPRAFAVARRSPAHLGVETDELVLIDLDRDVAITAWQGAGLADGVGRLALSSAGDTLVFEVDLGGLTGGRLLMALDTHDGELTELGLLPSDVGMWSWDTATDSLVMAGGLPDHHDAEHPLLERTPVDYWTVRLVAPTPGLDVVRASLGQVRWPMESCGSCLFAQRESAQPGDDLLELLSFCVLPEGR